MQKFFLPLILLAQGPAHAACFSAQPLKPPGADNKLLVDYEQEGLSGFGRSQAESETSPYPPKLPDEKVKVVENARVLEGFQGKLKYYEFAKNYGWRICREDLWLPNLDERKVALLKAHSERYAKGNSFLEGIAKQNRALTFSTIYSYDDKGRIKEISEVDLSESSSPAFKALHCRRYDERDRLLLWVRPSSTRACPKDSPSPNDEWYEYRYGVYNGESVLLRSRWHIPQKDGRWKEEWRPFRLDSRPDSVRGNAYVDSARGVSQIFGSTYGRRDNNSANTVVDAFGHWNGATYFFTNPPVPISVLENPEELYQFERRRMTRLDNHTRLFELFKPNEHISRHRFYMLSDFVLRHEQLDQQGRIRRIITINNWRQPRPGPKPDFNDMLLARTSKGPALRQVHHRVYDVDVDGQPTLVAVSWSRSLRNPLKSAQLPQGDLIFGTPDGKERWKTREEFDRAFDTSSDGRQIFPDSQKSEE